MLKRLIHNLILSSTNLRGDGYIAKRDYSILFYSHIDFFLHNFFVNLNNLCNFYYKSSCCANKKKKNSWKMSKITRKVYNKCGLKEGRQIIYSFFCVS